VRFTVEQRFTAPLAAVEAAFVDAAMLAAMAAREELGHPMLLEKVDRGSSVTQRVRYAFTGHLSPAVTKVLDPERLTWVEESELDRATHRTAFTIHPDHYADRRSCLGTVALDEVDAGTRRTVDGDLTVRFPLVAAKVERAIVSGLHDHARAEARFVQAWLDAATTASGTT
jgi:hypothetical protein